VAGEAGLDHELVFVDEPHLRQRERQRHAAESYPANDGSNGARTDQLAAELEVTTAA
jgi:hypothetical protein